MGTVRCRASWCFVGTMLAAFVVHLGNAHDATPISNDKSPIPSTASRLISDTNPCTAKPLGEITVATLNNAPIITLLANGHPVVLLLDTGANTTTLRPDVAERIGAQPPRVQFQRQLHGISSTMATREVELRSFVAGGVSLPWRRVAVAPVTTAAVFSAPLDGLLGADVLSGFDIDLDIPHHRMTFYQKGSCPNGPPWNSRYVAIPVGQSADRHLFFPVQLDGRTITGIIDTGAQRSFLSEAAARSLGVTEAALARDPSSITQGISAERLPSLMHRFSGLKIGSELIRDPEFAVGNAKLGGADAILGIDFVLSRRIWLSYGSFAIFLSAR